MATKTNKNNTKKSRNSKINSKPSKKTRNNSKKNNKKKNNSNNKNNKKNNNNSDGKPELEKVLDFKTLLLIAINSIMGTGIFFLPSVGARYGGPASIISWVLLSFISIYIAMCFGELVSMFPTSGGVYEYCKQAFGRFAGFIVGWLTIISANITIAMLIVGAIQYLLPFDIPQLKIPIALTFILIFNYIAYKGMKTSAAMLVTFAFITMVTLFSIMIPNFFNFQASNLQPFFVFPMSAIFITIFYIAETFFGWESTTFLAEETKDSARVVPKAIVLGTIIIAIFSVLFVISSLGIINWQVFGQSIAPLVDLGFFNFGFVGKDIFTILVYMAIIGSVAGWAVTAPRLLLAMAKDKLFLSQLSAIHPKNKTPYKAIIFQTVVSCIMVFVASGSYEVLLHLLVPLLLVMYSMVLAVVVYLRIKKPNIKRYFKVPFGKVGPVIMILVNIMLLFFWAVETEGAFNIIWIGASFLALGIPIYYLLELYYNPKTVTKTNDMLARFSVLTERFFFPTAARKRLIVLLGNLENKKILEFGSSIGTLTIRLSEEVQPKGKVYATESSDHNIKILRDRMKKHGCKNVRLIKSNIDNIPKKIPKLDSVISIGLIGSIEKEEKVLKQLSKKMKKGARIVFLDFDKFFDVIPNIEWLSDDKLIKKIFRKSGFDVDVFRKQGFAWEYIYIYGVKK